MCFDVAVETLHTLIEQGSKVNEWPAICSTAAQELAAVHLWLNADGASEAIQSFLTKGLVVTSLL